MEVNKRSKSSASECLENPDLLMNILSHLDTPSIARSRLVCKSWTAASTSEYFLRHHYKPDSNSLPWVIFADANTAYRGLWRPFSGQEIKPTFLSSDQPVFEAYRSSNGLICGYFGSSSSRHGTFKHRARVLVGNPILNSWYELCIGLQNVDRIAIDSWNRRVYYGSGSSMWSAITKDAPDCKTFQGVKPFHKCRAVIVRNWCNHGDDMQYFSYKCKLFVAMVMYADYDEVFGFSIWEWNANERRWFVLSKVRVEELLGESWRSQTWNEPASRSRLKHHLRKHLVCLVGDVLIFNRCGLLVAFHMADKCWEGGKVDSKTIAIHYAFVPSLYHL